LRGTGRGDTGVAGGARTYPVEAVSLRHCCVGNGSFMLLDRGGWLWYGSAKDFEEEFKGGETRILAKREGCGRCEAMSSVIHAKRGEYREREVDPNAHINIATFRRSKELAIIDVISECRALRHLISMPVVLQITGASWCTP
jgi:hypothetical protein